MPTSPDAKTQMWNLQEQAEIDRLWREVEIARALCERGFSPDNDQQLVQAWNAYADHVHLPKASRGEGEKRTSIKRALMR